MKRRQMISGFVAAIMLVSSFSTAFASEPLTGGSAEIAFSAARYNAAENKGDFKVTVIRSGGSDRAVSVAFKTADFMAEYGIDYVVLDEDGRELPVTEGIAPEYNDFKQFDPEKGIVIAPSESTKPAIGTEPEQSTEPSIGTEPEESSETTEPEPSEPDEPAKPDEPAESVEPEQPTEPAIGTEPAESAAAAQQGKSSEPNESAKPGEPAKLDQPEQTTVPAEGIEPEETTKPAERGEISRTGSSLLDAQSKYLNLPDDNAQAKENVETVLSDMNSYLQEARGAVGVLNFRAGETKKDITIRIIDNDKPQADKIVILALMGVRGDDNTCIAANPTAYLNITDDEEYETPHIEPEAAAVTLTAAEPEYELTLFRTAGVDYYTSVSVSTVKETAVEGVDYDKMDNVSVAFAPGETSKTIRLAANRFEGDKSFGIRIESDGTCDIANEYITVHIASGSAGEAADAAANPAGEKPEAANLNAAESGADVGEPAGTSARSLLGYPKTTLKLDHFGMVHGPSTGSQDGRYSSWWNASGQWTDYNAYETYKHSGRSWVASKPLNLTGISNVAVSHKNDGSYRGSYAAYHMFIELLRSWDRYNYNAGGDSSVRINDRHNWSISNLSVSHLSGDYYLRFGVRNDGYASDNGSAWLGNPLTLTWQAYSFDTSHSDQFFNRFLYDYADKTGETMKIAFTDGSDDYDYYPGNVHFETAYGGRTDGFYANANQVIKPVADNAAQNRKYGIELEGVYLYTKSENSLYQKDRYAPYEDHWYTGQTVWIPASGVNADQKFCQILADTFGAGVTNIKVMPKFKQNSVTVDIHNTDNEKTYIANLTSKNGPSCIKNGSGYYNRYTFPVYSKLKLRAVSAPKKTITGFYINLLSKETKDDPIIADSEAIERMTYTVEENLEIYPRTENQGMNVALMPGTNQVVSDLSGRVFRQPSTVDASASPEVSDASGNLTIESVYPGMQWIMRATAPAGYYVKWTNGTGDIKNVNGRIDVSSDPNINEETANTKRGDYNPIYGDILAGRINQDNTKYYYEFIKANGGTTGTVWGNVKRENGSVYDVVNRRRLGCEPVANAQVSVAGTAGFTDRSGDFVIQLENVPTSGMVSVIVDDAGTPYPVTALANYMSITLPPYECFKPTALNVRYGSGTVISGTTASIEDDTLTVLVRAESSGSIQPVNAKFYIRKANGNRVDCSANNRFTSSFANNTAQLSFNPKAILDSGDKIDVAFIDQNGKEYKPMDLGYTFLKPLDLGSFLFPLIGSELVEGAYGKATELIGDPLGNISLGRIGLEQSGPRDVTPPGMDPELYSYPMTTYKFGDYSNALETFGSEDGEDGEPDSKPDSEEVAENVKKAVKDAGKETDGGGYKTEKSFSWSLSPKAAFALQITTRQGADGQWKYYFEELDFLVGLDYNVGGKITVTLPIGMNIIITGTLQGDVTGVYQLRTDYSGDSTWDKNKVEYVAERFGLFEEIDNVDRKVYMMLNPTISLGLSVTWAIVEVGGYADFAFDMDFEFGMNRGDMYSRMYGDMTYSFRYDIKVLSIKIYGGSTPENTVELFSKNADGHIEPDIIAGLLSAGGDTSIQSEPVSRAYLNSTSRWNPDMDSVKLLDIGAAEGTAEATLQEGVYPSSKFKLTKFGGDKILMTYIGDVANRSDINRTGLFYSIFDGSLWSEPQLVEDDGTLDDYVDAFDLGDQILVSWSSADRVLDDETTAAEALTALDIKTAFFDKASGTFGAVTQLTHTTDGDYTADVSPKAAYDSAADRIILYYTKTEYKDMQKLEDIVECPSVIAYRFYENGAWNGADSYTEEELSGVVSGDMTDAEKEAAKERYKTNWYGQRFLDVRINKNSGEMLRIVDSDAISYNGLALYAWTVDYDKDLNTTEDRDVFLQIYNFSENSFTHIIKITSNSGNYAAPQFGRFLDETYLFFSAAGDLGNGEDENGGGIAYVNVGDAIRTSKYSLVSEGSTHYYKLQYETTVPETTNSSGVTIPEHQETVSIKPTYAAAMNGYLNNYSVDVDADERMYLTWSDFVAGEDAQTQVFTSIYDKSALIAKENGGSGSADGANSPGSGAAEWSEPFMLTAAPSTAYRNIDAAVIDSELYIAANKTPYVKAGTNTILDEDRTSMVVLKHTPYSKPVTAGEDALSIDTDYVYPNVGFTLTSAVKNEGIKLMSEPVSFRFSMTADGKTTDLGLVTSAAVWGGGKTLSVGVDVPALAEISDDLTFHAVVSAGDVTINQTMKAVKESDVISDGDAALVETTEGHELAAPLRNNGNLASGPVSVTLYTAKDGKKDRQVAKFDVESIPANTTEVLGGTVQIPDEAYTITEGDGVAEVIAVIETEGEETATLKTSAHRSFDAEAIAAVSKVTGVSLKGSGDLYVKSLEDITIETQIKGGDADEVKVAWISDNPDVVYVREDGTLCAIENGKAKLTGYVVPVKQNIVFSYDGTAEKDTLLSSIPSTLYQTVTANVTVGGSRPSGSGGGGSSSKVPETPVAPVEPAQPVKTVQFDDTVNHWAKDAIQRLAGAGIVKGVSDHKFEPEGIVTRAQFVQMLMNSGLVKKPEEQAAAEFRDVEKGAWYYDAVQWAVSCGLATGTGESTFDPDAPITREQMAVIADKFIKLAEAAGHAAKSGQEAAKISFTDAARISDWADEAVAALSAMGVISGRSGGEFDPQADMIRAESAVVICKILDLLEADEKDHSEGEAGEAAQ